MKKSNWRQYTIRGVPNIVDRALRRKARSERKSLNEVAVEALHRHAGLDKTTEVFADLDGLIGSWENDPAFDRALAEQDLVDEKLWR
jgi:hypothetical protein